MIEIIKFCPSYYFKVLVLKSVLIETGHWFLAMVKGVRVRLHMLLKSWVLSTFMLNGNLVNDIYRYMKRPILRLCQNNWKKPQLRFRNIFCYWSSNRTYFSFYYSLHTRIKSMFILGDSNNFGSEFIIHDFIRNENEVISSLFM